jgi:hypothetical protein
VLEATGIDAPVDARELAAACGLDLAFCRGRAKLRGGVIWYDPTLRSTRQHGQIAHEVAHYVLRRARLPDPDQAARYVAGSLLPGTDYDRDLRETAWDLDALQRRHPNASAELLARRLSEKREAVVTVLDQGRVTSRTASPWLPAPPARLTAIERELVSGALESGQAQRANELLSAWPRFDGAHRRVIVIADAQQLALRF